MWVEDPAPHCTGTDIQVASYYERAGSTARWQWPTTMRQMHSLAVVPHRARMWIASSAEGSPDQNPNRVCGSEAASLTLQTRVNGTAVTTRRGVIPASGGMGHLVLSSANTFDAPTEPSTVELWLGSNTAVTRVFTGGCCGDAILAVVQLP